MAQCSGTLWMCYSRILLIKFKLSKVKVCVVDSVGYGYRLCILGNLNGWIGNGKRADITGAFRVPGENDNEGKVAELCAERELCRGSTNVKRRSLLKYTRVARGQDGVEVKSMIDLVLVKGYVQDVRMVYGMEQGLSNHHAVLCKVSLLEHRLKRKRRWMEQGGLEARNLMVHQYREGYDRFLESKGVE